MDKHAALNKLAEGINKVALNWNDPQERASVKAGVNALANELKTPLGIGAGLAYLKRPRTVGTAPVTAGNTSSTTAPGFRSAEDRWDAFHTMGPAFQKNLPAEYEGYFDKAFANPVEYYKNRTDFAAKQFPRKYMNWNFNGARENVIRRGYHAGEPLNRIQQKVNSGELLYGDK